MYFVRFYGVTCLPDRIGDCILGLDIDDDDIVFWFTLVGGLIPVSKLEADMPSDFLPSAFAGGGVRVLAMMRPVAGPLKAAEAVTSGFIWIGEMLFLERLSILS